MMLSSELHGKRALPVGLIAQLGALALFLSTIEYMIPKPIPFMRLGLANVPIMLALPLLDPAGFFLLVLMKILGQALVNGTLFSYIFLFSLCGSVSSSLVMFLLYRRLGRFVSYLGISMAGALTSNLVQLLLSRYIMFGPSVWIIAPPFLIMGLVTSIVLGLFVMRFSTQSAWFAGKLLNGSEPDDRYDPAAPGGFSYDRRVLIGLLALPAFLLQQRLPGTLIITVCAVILAVTHGRRFRLLPNLLVIISVTAANLLQKNGIILTEILGFPITLGALELGLKKALTLIGLIYISQFMVSNRPRIPGRLGALISLQLFYFERITESWDRKAQGNLLGRIDTLLFTVEGAEYASEAGTGRGKEPAVGWQWSFVVISWGVLVAGFVL